MGKATRWRGTDVRRGSEPHLFGNKNNKLRKKKRHKKSNGKNRGGGRKRRRRERKTKKKLTVEKEKIPQHGSNHSASPTEDTKGQNKRRRLKRNNNPLGVVRIELREEPLEAGERRRRGAVEHVEEIEIQVSHFVAHVC